MVNKPNDELPDEETAVSIPEWEIEVENILADNDLLSDEQTLMARIPLLAGNNKKVAYLAYRSCGFTIGQSCELARCTPTSVHNWRKSDPVFRRWEQEELPNLQKNVGPDIIKFEFMRNMRMLLRSDMMLIAKGMSDLEHISPREYELFKNLRRFYQPAELLALDKIISPTKHSGPVTFHLTWGTRVEVPQIEGTGEEITDGEYAETDDT